MHSPDLAPSPRRRPAKEGPGSSDLEPRSSATSTPGRALFLFSAWALLCLSLWGCPSHKTTEDAGPPVPAGPKAVDEKEPNDDFAHAQKLTEPSIVSGTIGAAAGGKKADEDWYRLELPAGKRATVTLDPAPGLDLGMEVFDQDQIKRLTQEAFPGGQAEVVRNLGTARPWVIRVSGKKADQAGGTYRLTVALAEDDGSQELEPNNRAADSTPMSIDKPIQGYLTDPTDEDWFRLTLPAPPDAGVAANSTDTSTIPIVTAPAPTGMPAPTAPIAPSAPSAPTAIADKPTAPDSTDKMAKEAPAAPTSPTSEAKADTTPAPTPTAPTSATAPTAPTSPTAPSAPSQPNAVASLPPLPPPVLLHLTVTGVPNVRLDVQVVNAAEAVVFSARGKNPGEGVEVRNLALRDSSHDYFVVIRSASVGSGKDAKRFANIDQPYTLTVGAETATGSVELEPNDDPQHATPLNPNGGTIDGFLSPKNDVDYFLLHADKPQLAKVELSGVEHLDLELSVVRVDASGKEQTLLTSNDGEVKEPEMLTNLGVGTGDLYLKVEGASKKGADGKWTRDYENAKDPYHLTVTLAPDDPSFEREPNNTPDTATPISVGMVMRGTIHPKKDVDLYRLDLTSQPVKTNLKITCTGVLKVDVALYLLHLNPDGSTTLAQTSDTGKGDAPEVINYPADPGVYLIKVQDTKNRESNFLDFYQLRVETP